MRKIIVTLVLMVMIGGAVSYGVSYIFSQRPTAPRREVREQATAVEVQTIRYGDFTPRINLFGELIQTAQVRIRPRVSGEVIKINSEKFREGAFVGAGDLLLSIDPFTYEGELTRAQADSLEVAARLKENAARLEQAQVAFGYAEDQFALAQKTAERIRSLFESGSATQAALDDSTNRLTNAQASRDQQKSQLVILEAQKKQIEAAVEKAEWSIANARRNLESVNIRAPFDGFLRNVSTSLGAQLSPNDVVAEIIDANNFDVRFSLSDEQYGRLLSDSRDFTGSPVSISWQRGTARFDWQAKVDRVAATVSSSTGGVDVFARLNSTSVDRETKAILRPGVFVEVSLNDKTYENVIAIPSTAIFEDNVGYKVVDSRAVRITFQIAGLAEGLFLVRSDDLKDGDRLNITSLTKIGEGTLLRVRGDEDQPLRQEKGKVSDVSANRNNGKGGGSKRPALR